MARLTQEWIDLLSANPSDNVCQCCGREVKLCRAEILELDQRTNAYHDFGDVPEGQSQGWFLFGSACAKKARKAARAALLSARGEAN